MTKQNNVFKSIRRCSVALVVPLFMMAEAKASIEDVHEIIDICTSSERIMKDYAMIQMGISYHDPKKDMEETLARLHTEMADLEKHKVTKDLHDEEVALHKEWDAIDVELALPPSKEVALRLHHHINTFAKHCETLAEHLATDTGNPAEHYVVLIARLNLDVQELAGAYIMKAWGAIPDGEYYQEVADILKDFNQAYDELQSSESNMVSDKVKAKLKVLKKHFMVFEFMAESKSGRFVPLLIAKKAEKIYAETIKILKLEESEVE
ncbi:MAG: hypothetical protein Q9M36_10930 [Sulfurovum sp.]|nr:hypothetical protein [Sulfurovum sp.]